MKKSIIDNPSINSRTELYCIFGNPVKHSLSPAMQNAAFRSLGIDAVYLAFETDDIKKAILAMKALNIRGASITIPHKEEALKYVDRLDPLAKEIGAVNTLKNEDGRIFGYNTDGLGAMAALAAKSVQISNARILLLGNGGSARAISYCLLKEGARVIIAGRNPVKIKKLVKNIKKKYKLIEIILLKNINQKYMDDIDIIINTTPVGMAPDINKTPVEPELIEKRHVVFDIVYSPGTTRLLEMSREKGCKIIYGIEMLINQGAKQFEIWTGEKAPLQIMEEAVRKKLSE